MTGSSEAVPLRVRWVILRSFAGFLGVTCTQDRNAS